MKRSIVLLVLLLFAMTTCTSEDPQPTAEPTPEPLDVSETDIAESVLGIEDVGDEEWNEEDAAAPSTVQIGGKVGPANMQDAEAEATSGFTESGGSGYLSNSVFLLEDTRIAQAVMALHREAAEERAWSQERMDGGTSRFERSSDLDDVAHLGEESYAVALSVNVTDASGRLTERRIEYVVFRIDRILSFLVAQDADVATHARRHEQKLASLAS